MISLKLGLRNLLRNRWRSGLTLAAVAVAVGLMVWTLGFYGGWLNQMVRGATAVETTQAQIHTAEYVRNPRVYRTFAFGPERVREAAAVPGVVFLSGGQSDEEAMVEGISVSILEDETFAGYVTHYENAWRAFDDAYDALTGLAAAGLATAVLTNGSRGQQLRKLEIETEAQIHFARREAPHVNVVRHHEGGVLAQRSEMQVHGDARIELDPVERGLEERFRRRHGIAVVAYRALADEGEAVRAVVQVVEDLRVGGLALAPRPDEGHDGGVAAFGSKGRSQRAERAA